MRNFGIFGGNKDDAIAQLAAAGTPLATVAMGFVALWSLCDFGLLTRGRALDLEMSRPLGRIVRVLALAAVVANWLYLVAAGR